MRFSATTSRMRREERGTTKERNDVYHFLTLSITLIKCYYNELINIRISSITPPLIIFTYIFQYIILERVIIVQIIVITNQQMFQELQAIPTDVPLIESQTLLQQQSPLFLRSSLPLSEQLQADLAACQTLLKDIQQGEEELGRKIEKIHQEYSTSNFNSGISYFDTKNILMNQYIIELHFYILFKLNGVDLTTGKGLELIKNLLYLKTLMMKLGPIEKKLQYKTQKILREGLTSFATSNTEAISLKPNPRNLMEQRTNTGQSKLKKYIVPKITPALMPDDKQQAKFLRNQQRGKMHLERKLRDHFRDEDDQVEVNMMSEYDKRTIKRIREKEEYEERTFSRLPETRKEKQDKKRLEKLKFNDVGDLSEMRQMKDLLKYTGLIEQDYEKQAKADKLLERTKKINKKKFNK